MALWITLLLPVVLAQEAKIWQLSSETQVSRFSPATSVLVPYSNRCFEGSADYTVVFWIWRERLDVRTQLFVMWDYSQTHNRILFVTKGPGTSISLFLFQGSPTLPTLTLQGAQPKLWELISVVISKSTNSTKLCSATKEISVNCSSQSHYALPIVSTSRTLVALGARDVEIIDAKIYNRVLTADEIQFIARRGISSSSFICMSSKCFGIVRPDFSCYSSSMRIGATVRVSPGQTWYENFYPKPNFNKIYLYLQVNSGDADLYMTSYQNPEKMWASRLPGSDSLTVTRNDSSFLLTENYRISIPCYSGYDTSFRYMQEVLDAVPIPARLMSSLYQVFASENSIAQVSIIDLSPSEGTFPFLALLAAVIGVVGLAFYCGSTKMHIKKELQEKLCSASVIKV